jgi:hypothetical protein
MKMFSEGDAAIPALGMEEIPKQVAKQLPEDAFIFKGCRYSGKHNC